MNTTLTPEEIDRLARKRVRAKMGWFVHATVFVLVNLLVLSMSEYGFGTRRWSAIPFLGWGLGLTMHGASVWLLGGASELRQRMEQRERLQREQDRRNGP
jgi:hypothetical protein